MSILGTGVDIVECLRIARAIEDHGEQFLARVFTPLEIDFCSARAAATQHYAGHWAAKEAVLKALQTNAQTTTRRGIAWRDIEIRYQQGGVPTLHLRGGAKEMMVRNSIEKLHLSISHCRSYAIAHVVAEGEDFYQPVEKVIP